MKALSFIETMCNNTIEFVNKLDSRVLLIILLTGNYLTFIPDSNEENYLQLAKQFYSPEWIPESITLTEFAGARILYQSIVGFLLSFLSFEVVTWLGHALICMLFAWSLHSVLKRFKLDNITLIFLLQVLFIPLQSFFGGEVMLLGMEAKHFAYVFLFYSLGFVLDKKYYSAILCAVAATYFHFLVGGWWTLYLIFYLLFSKEVEFKKLLIFAAIYISFMLPLVIYLYEGIVANYTPEMNGVKGDWIYSYFRGPHHIGIFRDLNYFFDHHIAGIIITFCCLLISVFIFPKQGDKNSRKLNTLAIIIYIVTLSCVIIAFFDRSGSFVKFYPFRANTLSCLFVFILSLYYFKQKGMIDLNLQKVFLIFVVLFFAKATALNLYKQVREFTAYHKEFDDMTNFIKKNTPEKSVIYFEERREDYSLSFTRKAERDPFVVYKFVPGGTNKIYDWYNRLMEEEKVNNDLEYLQQVKEKYKVGYYVSQQPEERSWLEMLYSNEGYYVYKIK